MASAYTVLDLINVLGHEMSFCNDHNKLHSWLTMTKKYRLITNIHMYKKTVLYYDVIHIFTFSVHILEK